MINLDKNKKYVVACSFGPDSMALLSMMQNEKLDFVVAHVNYHKRKESNNEEKELRNYCNKNSISLFVLDTRDLKPSGNFQEWARRIRYSFFKDIAERNNCDGVVVAHQQDDLIETFLMQESKNSFVAHYGIDEKTLIFGVKVFRPLLSKTKKELELYCEENNVPYSIDSSNLTDVYTRNKYRHEIVEKLNKSERTKILEKIEELNNQKLALNIDDLSKNIWDLQYFLNENNNVLILQISNNLQKRNVFKKMSQKWIEETKKAFAAERSNVVVRITKTISLVKSYSEIILIDLTQFKQFEYVVEKPGSYCFEFIDFEFRSGDKDRNLVDDSFPVVIRPVKNGDHYKISTYDCEVRRLFIDWKLPKYLRGWWPGIYDCKGNLVYIPRYRKEYTDKHTSKFVIKFPQF